MSQYEDGPTPEGLRLAHRLRWRSLLQNNAGDISPVPERRDLYTSVKVVEEQYIPGFPHMQDTYGEDGWRVTNVQAEPGPSFDELLPYD